MNCPDFPQLPELADLAKAIPDLPIILNHIGGLVRTGPYANKDEEVLATWRRGIAAVGECPNVTIKLGGIGMPRTGFDWHLRQQPIGSEELAAAIGPFITYRIEQFGPSRCMFESNFPVDKVSFSYQVMYNAFKRLSRASRQPNARKCSMTRPCASIVFLSERCARSSAHRDGVRVRVDGIDRGSRRAVHSDISIPPMAGAIGRWQA